MRKRIISGVVVLASLPLIVVATKRIDSWVAGTFDVSGVVYSIRASTLRPLVDVRQDQIAYPDVYAIEAVRMYEVVCSGSGCTPINGTKTNFRNVRWSTTGEWEPDGSEGAKFPGELIQPDPANQSTWYYSGGQWTADGSFTHLGFFWHVYPKVPVDSSEFVADLVLLGYQWQAPGDDVKLAIDYNLLRNEEVVKKCTATFSHFYSDLFQDGAISPGGNYNNTCTP